jgi:hypothetical protein
MLEVIPAETIGASEQHVVHVVDALFSHVVAWVFAVVLVSLFLFLSWRLPGSEWSACSTMFMALLAFSLIWCRGVTLPSNTNTASALKNKVIIADLGDKMLTPSAVAETGLVVDQ